MAKTLLDVDELKLELSIYAAALVSLEMCDANNGIRMSRLTKRYDAAVKGWRSFIDSGTTAAAGLWSLINALVESTVNLDGECLLMSELPEALAKRDNAHAALVKAIGEPKP